MKLEDYLPFWDKLTGVQQRRLTGSAALRHFDQGAMVYGGGAECAGLILPVEGQLRAYLLTDEGRELTASVPVTSACFPPPACCGGSSLTCWWRRSGTRLPSFSRPRCTRA